MRGRQLVMLLLLVVPARADAQPPAPIDPALFAFPGTVESPASAVSAGLALADRWLGDDPYSNPAAARRGQITLSPSLVRVSRQDLRADNRNYDEEPGFFDGAGAAVGLPIPGDVALWFYASQPALRLEDFAFTRGTGTDPSVAPAVFVGQGETREQRVGAAVSSRIGALRIGAAMEWMRREDSYVTTQQSGAPDDGDRRVDFSGEGAGYQVGARFDTRDSGVGQLTIGLAARYLPALSLEGSQESDLLSGSSSTAVSVEQETGWEGGASIRWAASDAFRVLAAAGGRSERAWEGFAVKSGTTFQWSVAGEMHEPQTPLALRFGFGQEQQSAVPEPRAGVVGLGVGWDMEGTVVEVGAMRRSVRRANSPTSYDDRVVASVRVGF